MNYKTFESLDPNDPYTVFVVQVDGEIVAICHDERRCWSIANSHGTDNDGYPIADVVTYPNVEEAISAYGEEYMGKIAANMLRRGKDWMA